MTSTLVATAEPEAPQSPPARSSTARVTLVVLLVVALLVVVSLVTAHVVRNRTNATAGLEHHQALGSAAAATLDRDLQRALRQSVAARPASAAPWLGGPQLGSGQPIGDAQGSPRITTWLVRSTSDAVVARMVVVSDGYHTVLIEKWFDGGTAVDSCGYSIPTDPGGTTAAMCQKLIDSVPTSNR